MFCRKCGNQIPNDSKFCQVCGTGVIVIADKEGDVQRGFIEPTKPNAIKEQTHPVVDLPTEVPVPKPVHSDHEFSDSESMDEFENAPSPERTTHRYIIPTILILLLLYSADLNNTGNHQPISSPLPIPPPPLKDANKRAVSSAPKVNFPSGQNELTVSGEPVIGTGGELKIVKPIPSIMRRKTSEFDRLIAPDKDPTRLAFASKPDHSLPKRYVDKVNRKINRFIFPPALFTKYAAIEGTVKVAFVILRSGELGTVEVLEFTGSKLLVTTATKAIEISAPFDKLPASFNQDSVRIVGKVEFKKKAK
jgi:outer membrane biosynthesis protein TonB